MATILSTKVIHQKAGTMDGWPTLCRKSNGELLVIFSGNRKYHACPYGRTLLIRSQDNGETWSEAEVVNDTRLDDRDAGLVQTSTGALVMTWFTSVAFEHDSIMRWVFQDPEVRRREMATWRAISESLEDETRVRLLGSWARRCPSGDGGHWEEPVRLPVSAPHGVISLRDGRLLMVGKEIFGMEKDTLAERLKFMDNGLGRIRCVESRDDGRSWQVISEIDSHGTPTANEPHVVECADGTLVAMLRNEAPELGLPPSLAQCESHDGGHTWTPTRKTRVYGLPPHLCPLPDGRLLLSFCRRWGTWGQYATFSNDNGRTWCEPFPVAPPSPGADHGYPSTVQLSDQSFLTAYYEPTEADGKPCVKLSHWR